MKQDYTIRFRSKERKMLGALNNKYKLSVNSLADIFKVEPVTIERWLVGKNVPPYSTRLMIAEMYEKHKETK